MVVSPRPAAGTARAPAAGRLRRTHRQVVERRASRAAARVGRARRQVRKRRRVGAARRRRRRSSGVVRPGLDGGARLRLGPDRRGLVVEDRGDAELVPRVGREVAQQRRRPALPRAREDDLKLAAPPGARLDLVVERRPAALLELPHQRERARRDAQRDRLARHRLRRRRRRGLERLRQRLVQRRVAPARLPLDRPAALHRALAARDRRLALRRRRLRSGGRRGCCGRWTAAVLNRRQHGVGAVGGAAVRRHLGEQREVAVAVLLCGGSWLLQRKLHFGQRRDARGSVVGHWLRAVRHRRRLLVRAGENGAVRRGRRRAEAARSPRLRAFGGDEVQHRVCPARSRGEFVFTLWPSNVSARGVKRYLSMAARWKSPTSDFSRNSPFARLAMSTSSQPSSRGDFSRHLGLVPLDLVERSALGRAGGPRPSARGPRPLVEGGTRLDLRKRPRPGAHRPEPAPRKDRPAKAGDPDVAVGDWFRISLRSAIVTEPPSRAACWKRAPRSSTASSSICTVAAARALVID